MPAAIARFNLIYDKLLQLVLQPDLLTVTTTESELEVLIDEAVLSDAEIFTATANCIDAWNSLDLEAILATYTDDVVYRDPGTAGTINGKDQLRRYLTKFLDVWDMTFTVLEDRRLADGNGQLCIWNADIRRRGTDGPTVTQMGMDVIHVRDGQLSRDEAFMDRTPMQALTES